MAGELAAGLSTGLQLGGGSCGVLWCAYLSKVCVSGILILVCAGESLSPVLSLYPFRQHWDELPALG